MFGEQGFHPLDDAWKLDARLRHCCYLDTDQGDCGGSCATCATTHPTPCRLCTVPVNSGGRPPDGAPPGGEAFVDLMKDCAGKEQILERDPFLRPRFEQHALGRLPRLSEDKMCERKDSSQTLIDTLRPLKLRLQTPHVSLYRRRLQLSPGVRLQIELDVLGGC